MCQELPPLEVGLVLKSVFFSVLKRQVSYFEEQMIECQMTKGLL